MTICLTISRIGVKWIQPSGRPQHRIYNGEILLNGTALQLAIRNAADELVLFYKLEPTSPRFQRESRK